MNETRGALLSYLQRLRFWYSRVLHCADADGSKDPSLAGGVCEMVAQLQRLLCDVRRDLRLTRRDRGHERASSMRILNHERFCS